MNFLTALSTISFLIAKVLGEGVPTPENTFPQKVRCAKTGMHPFYIYKEELLTAVKSLGDHPPYGTHYIKLAHRDIYVFFKIEGALNGGFNALWAEACFSDQVSILSHHERIY